MGLGHGDVALAYNKLREITKCLSLLFPVGSVCLSPYRSDKHCVEWFGLSVVPPGSFVEPRLRRALSKLGLAIRSASRDLVSSS